MHLRGVFVAQSVVFTTVVPGRHLSQIVGFNWLLYRHLTIIVTSRLFTGLLIANS